MIGDLPIGRIWQWSSDGASDRAIPADHQIVRSPDRQIARSPDHQVVRSPDRQILTSPDEIARSPHHKIARFRALPI
jgi:hypothetical protein